MGQKVNPIGFRLGIVRGWDSLWYGGKDFAEKLLEDDKIRKYMKKRVPRAGISKVLIERTGKKVIIYIHTARPGIVIGKGGSLVDSIKEEIVKLTKKEIHINIIEIKRPELVAHLVAENIANQISNRINFKRAIKFSIDSTMRMGAKGIKVQVAGRLNGAEMARTQFYKEGRTPLHTLRADIDYALVEAQTIYGIIGVKVWICKGEIYEKVDFSPSASMGKKKNNRRGGDRRGGDKGRRRRN